MAAANIAKFGEMQRGHPLKGAGQLKKRLPREIFGFLAFDRDYRSPIKRRRSIEKTTPARDFWLSRL
jgi:hypothetical protein